MRLIDVVAAMESLDRDLTIYASEPWGGDSDASLEFEPEDGELPPEAVAQGMKYFLEVFVAQEFLYGWMKSQTKTASYEERCERLIRHAIHDA